MQRSLDDLRAEFPSFGFAIYAFEPGQPVTLEVLTAAGDLYQWKGPTVEAAILAGFPPEEDAQPAEPEAPETETSIFD